MKFPIFSLKGNLFEYEVENFPENGGMKTKRIKIGFPYALTILVFLIIQFLLKSA